MTKVVVSIGANTPDAAQRVDAALKWLLSGADSHISGAVASSPYSTPEHSGRFPDYINAVVIADTAATAKTLNNLFKHYEQHNGRTSESKKNGLIPIDLDLIVFDDRILKPKDFERPYVTIGLSQLQRFSHID